MKFELFVALRYLTATRKQTIVSVVSVIAIGGVMVGVMALVIALALMTGFSSDIQSKMLGAEAHVFLYGDQLSGGITDWRQVAAAAESVPNVLGAAPNVLDGGILEGPLKRERTSLRGIEPDFESRVTDIGDKLLTTRLDGQPERLERLLPVPGKGDRPHIVLGKDLAFELGVTVGHVVRYFSLSQVTLSPLGPLPKRHAFVVAGLFETGMFEYDRSWGLVHLTTAQEMLGIDDGATTVKLRVDGLEQIAGVTAAVRQMFGSRYLVRDLISLNRPLFSAFKLEKILMGITIGLIVVVASLNIVTTLTMMVMEKTKDIGIFRAMGATSGRVTRIFMLQGLVIGFVGTFLGLTLGVSACWYLDTYRVIALDTQVYYIPYLPFKTSLSETILIGVVAILIAFLATIYPALRAAALNTVEALRYE